MRYGLLVFAALAILVLSGMVALYLVNVVDLPGVPAPASYVELDPDVASIVQTTIEQVEQSSDEAMGWVRLGMVYEANDLPLLAQQTYRAVTVRFKMDSRGWYGLARVNAALGALDDAERAMRRAIELEPEYAPSHWRLGYWLFEQGRVEEAAQAFQRAAQLDRNDPAAQFGMARIALAQGDAAATVATLERLASAPPPNGPYAWQLLAGAYRQLGRMEDAETALLRGHGAAPQFRDPWQVEVDQLKRGFGAQLNQAKALLTFGRADEAIALLKKLHERKPDDPMVLNNIGTAYRVVGRFDESDKALEDAIVLQPQFIHAHFGKAMNLWTRSQSMSRQTALDAMLRQTLAHLDDVLELNASYAPALALRGEVLERMNEHEAAADAFEKAYRLQAQNAQWLAQAAQSLMAAQQWDRAAGMLDTVTRQSPAMATAWRDYGIVLKELNRSEEALRALHRAAELSPSDQQVRTALNALTRSTQPEAIGP